MPKKNKISASLVLVFSSGILHALSLTPINFWPIGFFILAPVFLVIERENYSIKTAIQYGLVLSLSFNTFTSYWLIDTIATYGNLPWIISVLVFGLYIVITSSRFVLFFVLIRLWKALFNKYSGKNILHNKYFAWTFIWGVSEFFGWQLFPVLGANMVSGDLPLIQSADLFGVHFVSLIWFIANLSLYEIVMKYTPDSVRNSVLKFFKLKTTNKTGNTKKGSKKQVFYKTSTVVGAFIVIVIHVYGYFSYMYWLEKEKQYETKTIGVVQGNSPLAFNAIGNVRQLLENISSNMVKMTFEINNTAQIQNKKLDLIVWPESAIPFLSYRAHPILRAKISLVQDMYPVPMLINDIDTRFENGTRKSYNNMWLISGDGKMLSQYHKILLLPFAEYMPFGEAFPFLKKVVPEISDFYKGRKMHTIDSPVGPFIPSICYELLPPKFTIQYFKKSGSKARIIINMTNDTWFNESAENFQHLEASRIRAIELRLPIVRATNSGISAYIDTIGRLHDPTGQAVKANRIYDIAIPEKSKSLFSLWGYIPFYLFLLTGSLAWIIEIYRRRKNIAK